MKQQLSHLAKKFILELAKMLLGYICLWISLSCIAITHLVVQLLDIPDILYIVILCIEFAGLVLRLLKHNFNSQSGQSCGNRWSPADDKVLKSLWPNLDEAQVYLPKRTLAAIRARARRIGLS